MSSPRTDPPSELLSKGSTRDRYAPWLGRSRRALLIGIDQYQCPTMHRLKGCVHDIERVGALLTDIFGFATVELRDAEATRSTIVEALGELLRPDEASGPQPSTADQVVLFWSGHGSRIRSARYGFFETLVPYDSFHPDADGRNAGRNRDLTECELYAWLLRLSETGAGITLLIDACHSGGAVRELAVRPRGVRHERRPEALLDKVAFLEPMPPRETDQRVTEARPASGDSPLVATMAAFRDRRPPSDRYVLLASCRDHQLCREVRDPQTGNHHGLFTLYLCRALEALRRPTSWRDLNRELSPQISALNPSQTVQLEGAIDRRVFGHGVDRPEPFVSLAEVRGPRGELAGGAVRGVVLGSTWHLFPPSAQRPDGLPAAEIRVDRTGADRSWGTLQPPDAPVRPGFRAFEHSRPGELRLHVALPASFDATVDARTTLARSPVLHLATTPRTADVMVVDLPARAADDDHALLPRLGPLPAPHWAIVDPGMERQLAPARAADPRDPTAIRQLLADLETLARRRFLFDLRHPRPEMSLARGIRFGLHARREGEPWIRAQPGDAVQVGDRVAFTLERDTTRHPEPLYITVLDLGLAGAITPIYPRRGRNSPWRTHRWEFGWTSDERLDVELPLGYPFPGEPPLEQQPDGATETVLIFLSRRFSDLHMLAQTSFATWRGSTHSTLVSILQLASGRLDIRSAPMNLLDGAESWALIRCPLRVVAGPATRSTRVSKWRRSPRL